MDELEHKYEVDIKQTEARQKLPQNIKDELKASGMMDDKGKLKLKGVSPKMLKRMKQEFVECPVLKRRYPIHPMFRMSKLPKQSNRKGTL